jgi:hypothetical protein
MASGHREAIVKLKPEIEGEFAQNVVGEGVPGNRGAYGATTSPKTRSTRWGRFGTVVNSSIMP